jgi:hypothetical protein
MRDHVAPASAVCHVSLPSESAAAVDASPTGKKPAKE